MASAVARLTAGAGRALLRAALVLLVCAAAGALPGRALAQADGPAVPPPRAAWPDWAVEHALPEPGAAGAAFVARGVETLLRDRQVRLRPEGHVRLERRAVHVANRLGLEAAGRVSIAHDPATETVTIHRLSILRGGRVLRHADLPLVPIRRESGLERGILEIPVDFLVF